MEIHFIYKLIKKYKLSYDYAKIIYLNLYERHLISEATDDINSIDKFSDFISKYYKETCNYE